MNVYEIVTQQIIEALESGTAPWHKPWTTDLPANLVSGTSYRGGNVFLLALTAAARGYSSPYWLTFKQAKQLGGHIRKGEKSTIIMFWKVDQGKDETEEQPRRRMILRYYRVFNAEQCEGIEHKRLRETRREHDPHAESEAIVGRYLEDSGPQLTHGSHRAAYSPSQDAVIMPEPEAFDSTGDYYGTLFHELTHSTGHDSRLARIESTSFGSHEYSKEELVAELGAAFLLGVTGQTSEALMNNSAAYLQAWLERLREDDRLFVQAAAQAQRAVDLIQGIQTDAKKEAA